MYVPTLRIFEPKNSYPTQFNISPNTFTKNLITKLDRRNDKTIQRILGLAEYLNKHTIVAEKAAKQSDSFLNAPPFKAEPALSGTPLSQPKVLAVH